LEERALSPLFLFYFNPIILLNWKYLCVNMNLPIYKIKIDMDDELTGLTAVSLVECPAVQHDFCCLMSRK
jgi:hypothetical protein